MYQKQQRLRNCQSVCEMEGALREPEAGAIGRSLQTLAILLKENKRFK